MIKTLHAVAKEDLKPNGIVTLVGVFSELGASVDFKNKNYRVSAKSVLGLLSITLYEGERFEIIVDGNEGEIAIAQAVLETLTDYFTLA